MSRRHYVDNAAPTTLTGPIGTSDTIFQVTSLIGFPTNFPYTATLDRGSSSAEQVLVTSVSGVTVTVTRNFNTQGAFAHAAGAEFAHTSVAADVDEANNHVNSTTGVHGVSGALVGTSGVQSLSSKTLVSPVLTSPTITGTVVGYPAPGVISPHAGLTVPGGWLLCDGTAVSRTTYAGLFAALAVAFTGATVSAITTPTITLAGGQTTANLETGMAVYQGTNSTALGVVGAVTDSTHFTVFGTGFTAGVASITVAPFGAGDGATTFNVPDFRSRMPLGGANTTDGSNPLAPGQTGGSLQHSHTLSQVNSAYAHVSIPAGAARVGVEEVATSVWVDTDLLTGAGTYSTGGNNRTNGAKVTGRTDTADPPYLGVHFIIKV